MICKSSPNELTEIYISQSHSVIAAKAGDFRVIPTEIGYFWDDTKSVQSICQDVVIAYNAS